MKSQVKLHDFEHIPELARDEFVMLTASCVEKAKSYLVRHAEIVLLLLLGDYQDCREGLERRVHVWARLSRRQYRKQTAVVVLGLIANGFRAPSATLRLP